jgi:hypothetical protein
MRLSISVLAVMSLALNATLAHQASAGIVTIDDFQTPLSQSTGEGILGQRIVDTANSIVLSPRSWNQSVTISGGVASTQMSVDATVGEAFLETSLRYDNFGTIDLRNGTMRIVGQLAQASQGIAAYATCFIRIRDSFSNEFEIDMGGNAPSQTEWNLDFANRTPWIDLSTITDIRIYARTYAGFGSTASLSLSLTSFQLVLIPSPAAAPLLALAGLTARGRRRK